MNKIKEISYLRGLATIFVILIHITSSYSNHLVSSVTYKFWGSFNCSLTFAVPTFLFISVLIMTYQTKNNQTTNWIKFTLKRVSKVLFALTLWTIIYTLYWKGFNSITLKNLLTSLILGNASYHLYFIPLIIQLYLIFPFIWFIAKQISKIKINLLSSFLLCFIIGSIFQVVFVNYFRLDIFKTSPYFYMIIFSYSLPIAIGTWIGFNYNEIKNFSNNFFAMGITILTIILGYYYIKFEFIQYTYKTTLLLSPFYWTIVTITLLYLLKYIKKGTFLNKISQNSFIIYLSHPLILDIILYKTNLFPLHITSSTFVNYSIEIIIKFVLLLIPCYLLSVIWYKSKTYCPLKKYRG